MKHGLKFATGLVTAVLVMGAATAEARQGVVRARGPHGAVTAVRGPNGGAGVRAHGMRQNADDSVTRASGGAWRTANGGTSARARSTTVNPDGSLSHSGQYAGTGPRGSVNSSGSVSRDANGDWTGGRTTTATNATTGNSYQGSTTIDPATGRPVHTGTCYDASGAAIACPR